MTWLSIAVHVIPPFSQELLSEHLGVHVRSNGLLLADLCRERDCELALTIFR